MYFDVEEASGHINPSLALAARLVKRGWAVHYLSAEVMRECIEHTGSTFSNECEVAPDICRGGMTYFEAYERLRRDELGPDSKAWEARAHLENLLLLKKLPGTIEWLRQRNPDVVLYCPLWNRVAQLASLCLGVAHVAIITIAGFGGFKKILDEFLTPEGASVDDVRELYLTSDINRSAIDELCAEPFNLSRSLFLQGAPIYYFGTDPPFGNTLGKHALVTTIASLRDPFLDSIEEEDKMYEELAGSKLHYIGPMIGDPGMLRASTHKAAWTEEERSLLVEYNKHPHRRRSMLRPSADDDKLLNIVKKAKSLGRRICLVTLGTVVTSDRAAFGWHGTGLGVSITGKELVQSVVNAAIDELGLKDDDNIDSSISADESKAPLLVLTVGQQPDALDGIVLPANAIARASVPQIDILRCMNSDDLFVHHGGQNSTMEGARCGIPVVVCPTFSDQPVNAAKLVALGVGLKVDRPTSSGPKSVEAYRRQICTAIGTVILDDTFGEEATSLKTEIASSGGEEEAECILLQAIDELK